MVARRPCYARCPVVQSRLARAAQIKKSSAVMPWRWVFESPCCLRGRLEPRLCDPLSAQGRSAAIHAARFFVSGALRASYRLTKNMHLQHEHGRGQGYHNTIGPRGQATSPDRHHSRGCQDPVAEQVFKLSFLDRLETYPTIPDWLETYPAVYFPSSSRRTCTCKAPSTRLTAASFLSMKGTLSNTIGWRSLLV